MQRQRSRTRRVQGWALAALLLGAGVLVLSGCSRGGGDRATPTTERSAVMTVTAAPLERTELARKIAMNGSVYAWQEVIIAPEVGGYRVAEVLVDVGDHVKAGQKLVVLSTSLLEAEVATKQAMVNQRKAELDNAESALHRGQMLAETHVLSDSDLDKLTADQLAKRAALASARADLETSQLRLKFTSVTAPDDGVITSRTVTVGQIAQAGSEMLRLLRNSRIEWRGEAPEMRLGELAPGQEVTVTTVEGLVVRGKIRVVSPTVATGNRTGLVYVDLPPDDRIRPGTFARGEIEIGRGPGFTVPLESVVSADGYSYVFIVRPDNTVERRRIETGAVLGDSIEVVSGVQGNESVVIKGAGFLKDGDLVNVGTVSGS
ncbi:MAG TPA: efflux RND transporter periplasmic adaptor subunit [Gammaproteobacteria bacterium]|nr:efflux RND transporter periplasmic adaptor subunit [Gammaproteobacteria bacterium]